MKLALRLMKNNPKAAEAVRIYNQNYEASLKEQEPKLYETLMQYRRQSLEHLTEVHPEYADIIHAFYADETRPAPAEEG